MTDLKAPTTYGPSAILTPANLVTLVRLAVAPVAFAMMLTDSDQSSWPLVALWFVLSSSDMIDARVCRPVAKCRAWCFPARWPYLARMPLCPCLRWWQTTHCPRPKRLMACKS